MKDTQRQSTHDGRFKVGDRVTVTTDWAHQLRRNVYDGRKTVEQIRAERTGTIAEIWTGGSDANPWWSVRIDCAASHPWEAPEDLEPIAFDGGRS